MSKYDQQQLSEEVRRRVVALMKQTLAGVTSAYGATYQLKYEESAALSYNDPALVERTLPLVWEIQGKLRVLEPSMTMKDKTLVLLYRCSGPVSEDSLVQWVEHQYASNYRRDVLRPAHTAKLIEFDATAKTVHISPRGIEYVEDLLARRDNLDVPRPKSGV